MAGVQVVNAVLNGVPKGSYQVKLVVEVPGVSEAPIIGAAVAVKQTGLPAHMDCICGDAVTVALCTRIVVVAVTVQPAEAVPIIVYVELQVGETGMGFCVFGLLMLPHAEENQV